MGKVVRLANLTMAMQIPRHGGRSWEDLTEEALLKCAVCPSFYWDLFLCHEYICKCICQCKPLFCVIGGENPEVGLLSL